MNKLVLKSGFNKTEMKALSPDAVEKRLQESSSIQAEMDTLKPYLKLKKLDAELPRWAEDMATFTGMTLQGRAEEVRLLKETERTVIQARENDNAA